MKTNHRRGYKAKTLMRRYCAPSGAGAKSELADMTVGAGYGGDASNGHRGYAHQKRGAKKFVRSRIRFHENAKVKKGLDDAV